MDEEMTPELEAWVRWKMLNPSPDVEPSQHDIFMGGYRAGITRAQEVIHEQFFGGPTRDMIEGWLLEDLVRVDRETVTRERSHRDSDV